MSAESECCRDRHVVPEPMREGHKQACVHCGAVLSLEVPVSDAIRTATVTVQSPP